MAMLDRIATDEPERPWISVPRDDDDLSKGFVDITFGQASNATNHVAAWLQSHLGPSDGSFEPFVYEGPKDLRTAFLIAAAAKVGRTILLMYAFAPHASKKHLVETTKCKTILFAETSRETTEKILADSPHVRGIAVPESKTWLTDECATPWLYKKAWEEAMDDPWIILHSSGTTGMPKPVTYTQRMVAATDLALSQTPDGKPLPNPFKGLRSHSAIPMVHLGGLMANIVGPVFVGMTAVLGPALKQATAEVTAAVLEHGKVKNMRASPLLLREMCRNAEALERLKQLLAVSWSGAPLDRATGDFLYKHVRLSASFGTTECGPLLTVPLKDPSDWSYIEFRAGQGAEFERISSKHYELVIRKDPHAWQQQIFLIQPDLDLYQTHDLFEKHPTKENLWRYVGRTDDVVALGNGEALRVAEMEKAIESSSAVHTAIIDGAGRDRPFLLVEVTDDDGQPTTVDNIWPHVKACNSHWVKNGQIPRALIIITDPQRPFLRSAKGSVLRKETLVLYAPDIEAMYSREDSLLPERE